jgi:hypothetical protein
MEGIVVIKDGMVLIYDLDRFLTNEQKSFLALQHSSAGGQEPAAAEQEST